MSHVRFGGTVPWPVATHLPMAWTFKYAEMSVMELWTAPTTGVEVGKGSKSERFLRE